MILVRILLSSNEGSGESAHIAYAQTRQNLRCSHSQGLNVDDDSFQMLDVMSSLVRQHARLNEAFAHMR